MGEITLGREQQQRAQVLGQLLAGRVTTADAATALDVSVRQVERWRPEFRERGPVALVHGNTGRSPANRLSEDRRDQILELARGRCAGFTYEHLADMTEELLGYAVSADTVGRLCRVAGILSPRPQRRRRARRQRRERCAREGEMVQMDGSVHDWLEGRGPHITLINSVEDATGYKWSRFFDGETLEGYMTVVRRVVLERGVPLVVYTDGISTAAGASQRFRQHAAQETRAQPKRALEELGSTVIIARSPEAKGRVERTHGTDQDRLVSLLRFHGASTLAEANAILPQHLRLFNRKFTVAPASATPAWLPRPRRPIDDILCIKERRVVSKDNTVRVYGHVIDIPPGSPRRDYAGESVDVLRRFDGSIAIHHHGRRIASLHANLSHHAEA